MIFLLSHFMIMSSLPFTIIALYCWSVWQQASQVTRIFILPNFSVSVCMINIRFHDSLSGGAVCLNWDSETEPRYKRLTETGMEADLHIPAVPVYQSHGQGSEAGEAWSVQSWEERGRPGWRM